PETASVFNEEDALASISLDLAINVPRRGWAVSSLPYRQTHLRRYRLETINECTTYGAAPGRCVHAPSGRSALQSAVGRQQQPLRFPERHKQFWELCDSV